MQESSLSYFYSQFNLFKQLPPNTDIHYSQNKKEFVITGGLMSIFPGAQRTANIYKGHSGQKLAHDLNQLTSDLHKKINERLVYIYEDFNEADDFLAEIKKLRKTFKEAAKRPSEEGGLLALAAFQDEDTKIKIQDFIRRTKKVIKCTETLLVAEKRSRKESSAEVDSKGKETLMDSISEMEAIHSLGGLLPDDMLNSIAVLNQEDIEGKQVTYGKSALYKISLTYNAIMNVATNGWDWWNQISIPSSNEKIFLGALPISRKFASNDLTTLTTEHNIGAVLSVVEPFEMNSPGSVLTPITANQWRHNGVQHKQLPTEDFKTMSLDAIEDGVEFIRKCVKQELPVYIHCKAGRGRSALVLTCYLIKYHGFTAEDAIKHIQKDRPQAKLEKAKLDTAIEYERRNRPS